MVMAGIDVSGWNGVINFENVAKTKQFVIIKAGFSRSKVDTYETNYKNAKAAGLHVGAYWYSTATSVDDAEREAQAAIKALDGKQFDMPIYYDVEEQATFNCGKDLVDKIVNAFCTALEDAGYFVGVYMARWWAENYLSEQTRERYTMWIADWTDKCRYSGDYGVWQYGTTTVQGVNGQVDGDTCYIDFPSIIVPKHFNGYGKSEPKKAHIIDIVCTDKQYKQISDYIEKILKGSD